MYFILWLFILLLPGLLYWRKREQQDRMKEVENDCIGDRYFETKVRESDR